MTTNYQPSEYVSVADTAKLIRKELKASFPNVKFSVRSKSYSGGASIRVTYTDGPAPADVRKVVKRFEGADFDPMQDLKSYVDSVEVDESGALRRIHYGADYIFVDREYTVDGYQTILDAFTTHYHLDPLTAVESSWKGAQIGENEGEYAAKYTGLFCNPNPLYNFQRLLSEFEKMPIND